jgi:hypothetical protein
MTRQADLVARLDRTVEELVRVIESVGPDRWECVPGPGIWSIGKDAQHVADAGLYHQWIVRLTIGESISARRPMIERARLVPDLSRDDAVGLLRRRTDEARHLIARLTDADLDRPTKPPRARQETLATTIERVLIGHHDVHRRAIEAKLAAGAADAGC